MPVRATKRGDERTPLDGTYDVLICGASFAGLAVARELAGSGAEVMVIDRYEIGERQTSACGIPTEWLRQLGLMDAERQRFDSLLMHTPHGDARYRLPWTFSTFDYRELCELLWRDCDARFETAKVNGRAAPANGDGAIRIETDRGVLASQLVVDALGWRRLLASRRRLPAAGRATLARAGGPPRRRRRGPRDLDRPPLRPRRLRLVLPGQGRAADRDRLLRPPLPRPRHDRAAGRGAGPGAGSLPGQLDPPQAAPGDRGRRLLRRRLGRALPAAQRRGNQDGALLRDRARPRAARRRRGPAGPRGGRRPLRRVQRLPRVEVPLDAAGPEAHPPRPAARPRPADPPAGVQALHRLVLRPLPPDRAARVRRTQRTIRTVPASSRTTPAIRSGLSATWSRPNRPRRSITTEAVSWPVTVAAATPPAPITETAISALAT